METIAIIGMGCRFPGAKDPESFWELLHQGVNAVIEVPPKRWEADAFYDPNPATPAKMNTRWGGFVEDIEKFDANFFNISPREMEHIDPQQRLILEVAWEALENAGIIPEKLAGTQTGVFVGIGSYDYHNYVCSDLAALNAYSATGTSNSVAANRLSYLLDLRGPSVAIDTACSSSLVAVHYACQSLQIQETDLCIVGGVNIVLTTDVSITLSQARMMSPDGCCKTFDKNADGYVRGEGCGVVVLKRFADACKDGDKIIGVIKGSAVNQDGLSNGLTAPNGPAQQVVIQKALDNAGVTPAEISYVEAHGTGTSLGDPIEVRTLGTVFAKQRLQEEPLFVGSVKTNIGHLEAAAGMAGLIKVVLALQHEIIPPNLHFQEPSPYINWAELPAIKIPTEPTAWLRSTKPRLAGVSSFGFGGTNAHVVLAEAPTETPVISEFERDWHLLTLSAKNETALQELAQKYEKFLIKNSQASFADICFTANTSRTRFDYRLSVVAASNLHLREQLNAFVANEKIAGLVSGKISGRKRQKIAFLFTGQGSQYVGMGRQLYEQAPVFRQTLQKCDEILRPYLEESIINILYPLEGRSLIDQTAYTQPALFALEYSLYQLWQSWGVKPNALSGHSVGEYVAACIAGVFSLEDGLKLIAARGRLMQGLPTTGEMVAVMASADEINNIINIDESQVALAKLAVGIAAYNTPNNTVISGDSQAIQAISATLKAAGIKTTRLQTSHAFHSPLMQPILAEFQQVAATITYNLAQIDIISNVTGEKLSPTAINAEYWCEHLRSTVKFADSIATLHQQGYEIFVELGAKPTLLSMGRSCLANSNTLWLASLRPGQEDWQTILDSLGQLYVRGVAIAWSENEQDYSRGQVTLPTYPFQRQRYWPEIRKHKQSKMEQAVNSPLDQTINLGIKGVQINGENLSALSDQPQVSISAGTTQRDRIGSTVRSLFSDLLQLDLKEVNVHTPFLEMGADSIILVNAVRSLENTYGIKIAIRQFFEEFITIDALTNYIDQNLDGSWGDVEASQLEVQPQQPGQPTATVPSPQAIIHTETANRRTAPGTGVEEIMRQQLQIMSQQLEVLRGTTLPQEPSLGATAQPTASTVHFPNQLQQISIGKSVSSTTEDSSKATPQAVSPVSSSRVEKPSARKFNLNQQQHIEVLVARYTQRTNKSKQLAQAHRSVWADRRGFINFRREIKEMSYPIVGDRSLGSRFWDVDGNEYVDLAMGFGVHFFGYNPSFIAAAMQEQIAQGLHIGPQSKIAGEVAQLICELTGMERVTFSNTGTEAVMTAVRLARATTGRAKIAMFGSSYHGHFDGVLAVADSAENGKRRSVPMAPGVLQSMVDDVLVLTYDSPQSLELIKGHAHELAAVLVEPVPSRQPNLQPLAFLQQLRHLTKEAGIALIFDECITGFRLHPGGAQAWFGIEADIVTYAKLVGGGMPIGIIAGKSIYMDKIDGGLWRYGDDSYPEVETTFFAGTFCKHPLAMAAARAVLKHLKMHGSALQEQVNQRTSRLAETLNAYFEKEGLPIQVWYCGSVFRFALSGNFSYLYQPLEMDLLVHHLIEKGVYIWEGRSCFLSTAHSEEDIDRVIQAVKDSVEELQKGGFFTKRSFALSEGEKVSGGSSVIPPDPLLQQSQQLPLDLMLTPKNICDSLKPELARKVSLNEAQKQLGILAQMSEDGSVAYNVSISLELKGSFQLAAMRKAVQTVVNRHEALRTIISSQNDFQEILPFLTTDVALVDFSNGSDACGGLRLHERELQVADWLKKESQEPFDLNNGPLFRFSILKLEEKIHLLVLTIHHIVVDGWSVGVILQELGALYSAECQGVVCRLEPPMQFKKYIEWQEKQSQTDAMAAHESYWLEQFAESIPVLDLPTDRHHPRLQTYKGSRQTRRLDVSLTREVKRFSTENGCTLLMTLLSVYTTLLHRLTGQNDIIVGMPTAGRSLEGSEKLVGYCAHILLVRSCIVGSESFLEYLRTLKNRLLEIYEHQDYPFARLIDKLNVARDESRSPLVTAIFNWDRPVAVPKMFELATDLFPKPISCTPFDISLNVMEVDRKLVLDCDYNTDLCDASTIERWLGHFQTLLEGVVANPQQCIAELPLLIEAERHQLLVEWNNTTKEYPFNKSIHQLFEEQVERTPDAVAVVYENQQLTYDKLNCRANQLAHYLRSLGVGPEVLVGICMERSLEMVVGLLGILKAGGAYMPLDPEYPIDRLCFMLEDAAVSVLLTQQRLVNRLPEHGAQQVFLDDIWEQIVQNNHDNPVSGVRAFHLANVIYTSGSTGTPKGVMVTHTGLCNLAQAQIQTFGLQNLSRILQFASLSFDASIWEVVMALGSGATLYLGTKDSLLPGMPLIQVLRDYCITHITLPPSALSVLPVEDLPTLQTMIVAGEACSPELITQWSAGRNFFNAYGPTEATVCATVAKCTDGDKKLPIGRPIANTQIYILDSNLQPVPIGVPGELHIGGAGLARGYLNRPELTTEKFIPNPFYNSKFKLRFQRTKGATQNSKLYKTGDLARYLPDGNIEYLGRIDNQIKIRGFRIELGEIEATLSQHPGVRENVVVAREDILGEKRLVAYFVPQLEQTPTTNDLRIFLKEKLPQYMVPSAFVSLESLPLTSNGKVDRKALPVPDSHNTQLAVSFVAPRTPVEKVLADIWANVLHLEQVSVLDNFFELGGHSLSTIRVMSQVNETFQIKLPLRHLFTAPTIALLAQTIKSTCGTDSIVSANEITPLNLQAEVVLDETIKPLNLVYQPVSEPKAILLTGATGFVGAFLLAELLQQTQADIYCLVRAANLSAGKQRLQETLKAYLLWEESFNERIIPVLGDLSQPLLDLGDEQFHLMARKIDSIYHNGALVNHVYPYTLLKAANVRGTEEVLRLASQIKIKPVHFISTVSVFASDEYFKLEVVQENDPLELSQGLLDGYTQSKWVAEKIVMMARDRGLPCSIYRLGRITWHSQTGIWNSNDMFYRFIKACIQLKSAPEMNNMVEITPVDYLAKVLIHLSQQPDSLDKAFHLMNSHSASWSQFLNCIRSLGYPLQQLSYEDWQAELLRNTQISSDNALYSAISLAEDNTSSHLRADAASSLKFDCQNTLNGLADTGICWPQVDDKLLQAFFAKFSKAG